MQELRLRITEAKLKSVLLPKLEGHLFHVTTRRAYGRIRQDGVIRSNQDGKLPFTFPQSQNSYFRKRGCVSLFDFRTAIEDQISEALLKFHFLNPHEGANPVFLILNESCYARLIPWSVSIPEEGCRAMVIPHVEAGYPCEVPLALVDAAMIVNVQRKSDLLKLREARRRWARNPTEQKPMTLELYRLWVKCAEGSLTKREERELKEWEDI